MKLFFGELVKYLFLLITNIFLDHISTTCYKRTWSKLVEENDLELTQKIISILKLEALRYFYSIDKI
jgi:hypothetical protein